MSSTNVTLDSPGHVSIAIDNGEDHITADLFYNAALGGVDQCNLHGFVTTAGR